MDIKLGDIVYSKAGRDKGGYFVVTKVEGEYALICDGKRRKTDSPKRKKLKHLALNMGHSAFIENKLLKSEKVTNTELRTELKEYNQKEE